MVFLSLSALVFGIGIHRLWKSYNRLNYGKRATAIILKNNKEKTILYHPVVRFVTHKQESITQELPIGYARAMEEGSQVEVIYDPNDPSDVEINSSFNLRLVPWIIIAASILIAIYGVLDFLREAAEALRAL